MTDNIKTHLSIMFFVSMLILPCAGLTIGWIAWDFKTGTIVAVSTFTILFLLAGISLSTVKDLSLITVSIPFLFGVAYTVFPDFILGPIDDAAVLAAGAILTFALWVRKQPETPKWIIFPLLAASLYTLVGSFIPGPVDELMFIAVSTGVSGYGIRKQLGSGSCLSSEDISTQISKI